MDFTLSKEHEMARTLFRDFAEKEVKPLAQEVDETEHFPRETVEKMAKNGFLGIPVPKEYTLGGKQQLTIIDEAGLYLLVLRSKLPAAEDFQGLLWVADS